MTTILVVTLAVDRWLCIYMYIPLLPIYIREDGLAYIQEGKYRQTFFSESIGFCMAQTIGKPTFKLVGEGWWR